MRVKRREHSVRTAQKEDDDDAEKKKSGNKISVCLFIYLLFIIYIYFG